MSNEKGVLIIFKNRIFKTDKKLSLSIASPVKSFLIGVYFKPKKNRTD